MSKAWTAASPGLDRRLALLRGDWTSGLGDASFDLVVANPPYIPTAEIETLAPEVRDHDPRLAPEILRVLGPGGRFAVEIGPGQAAAVKSLFAAAGAEDIAVHRDLGDRDRVVAGTKKPLGKQQPSR